jgi:hypothetical protein
LAVFGDLSQFPRSFAAGGHVLTPSSHVLTSFDHDLVAKGAILIPSLLKRRGFRFGKGTSSPARFDRFKKRRTPLFGRPFFFGPFAFGVESESDG